MLLLQHVQPGLLNGTAVRHLAPWKASRSVRCTSCDITLNSEQQARQHYAGKAHQRRLQKQLQQQRQQKEPEVETESRDEEPERRPTPVVDDVTRERLDIDADSVVAMQRGEGEYTTLCLKNVPPLTCCNVD